MKNIKKYSIAILILIILGIIVFLGYQKLFVSEKVDISVEKVDLEQESSADSAANHADIFD